MAFGLFIAVLLTFASEGVISQQTHTITWDRHWLNTNLTSYTLNVALDDRVRFICMVEDTEPPADKAENIINVLEEQYLNDCNVSESGGSSWIAPCVDHEREHDININDAELGLANRQSFQAGGVYYFTSFSDGSVESAVEEDARSGGACAADPPLRLTISISATETSFPSPTASVADTSATIISSTVDNVMMTTQMSTSTSSTTTQLTSEPTELPSPPPVTREEIVNGARLLSPIHSVLLLVLLITCIVIL